MLVHFKDMSSLSDHGQGVAVVGGRGRTTLLYVDHLILWLRNSGKFLS